MPPVHNELRQPHGRQREAPPPTSSASSCSAVDAGLAGRIKSYLKRRLQRHHAKLRRGPQCSTPGGELDITISAVDAGRRVRVAVEYNPWSLKEARARYKADGFARTLLEVPALSHATAPSHDVWLEAEVGVGAAASSWPAAAADAGERPW